MLNIALHNLWIIQKSLLSNVLLSHPASHKLFLQKATSKMFDKILNTSLVRIFVIDEIKEEYQKPLFKFNMSNV